MSGEHAGHGSMRWILRSWRYLFTTFARCGRALSSMSKKSSPYPWAKGTTTGSMIWLIYPWAFKFPSTITNWVFPSADTPPQTITLPPRPCCTVRTQGSWYLSPSLRHTRHLPSLCWRQNRDSSVNKTWLQSWRDHLKGSLAHPRRRRLWSGLKCGLMAGFLDQIP